MSLFFQIQNLQLSIFYMNGWEFLANLDNIIYVFFCNIINMLLIKLLINISWTCLYCFIVSLHSISYFLQTKSLFTHIHVSNEPVDFIHLPSFEYKAILLISLVKTLCLSLLNLCCILISLFSLIWIF